MSESCESLHPPAGVALREHAGEIARALTRPRTYLGLCREVALGSFHVATYPFGLLPLGAPDEPPLSSRTLSAGEPVVTDAETAASPVVLVHGWIHNRSAFVVMSRALRRAGFRHVHGVNYNPITADIPALAEQLGEHIEDVLARTGAERCQIVGHSMGGIIARLYVQELGGDERVDTVLTLGAPHRGTYSAYLGVGRAARQLRPGSRVLRRLQESARPSDVRWISYYSELDATIVPTSSGKIVHPALSATNIRLLDTGHLSFLLSGEVVDGVVTHLADRSRGREAPASVTPLRAVAEPAG